MATTGFLCSAPAGQKQTSQSVKPQRVAESDGPDGPDGRRRASYLLLALGAVPGSSGGGLERRVQAVGVEGSGAVVAGLQLSVLLTDGTVLVMLHVLLQQHDSSVTKGTFHRFCPLTELCWVVSGEAGTGEQHPVCV